MNILDVVWLLGQTLILAWVACGTIVTILESDDFRDSTFQTSPISPLPFHTPVNHRLANQSRFDIDW